MSDAEWKAETFTRALDRRVLVVAHTRIEGTWKAYVAATPGANHDNEFEEVLARGTPLAERVARAIFPFLEEVPYAS